MSAPRETENAWAASAPVPDTIDVEKYRARFATILDRGLSSSRLALPSGLDPNKHYEFVAVNSEHQMDARSLGFKPVKIQAEPNSPESLHNTADGNYVVGDVMLMEIPKVYKSIIDDEYRKRIEAKHGKPGAKTSMQREERQMKTDFERTVGLPTIDTPEGTSTATPVNAEEIRSAVKLND